MLAHMSSIIGYDESQQTFGYVDSANYADRTGFGTNVCHINQQKAGNIGNISAAEIWEVIPPKPVPAAIINVSHKKSRMDLNLWLSVEGSPHPKRKIGLLGNGKTKTDKI